MSFKNWVLFSKEEGNAKYSWYGPYGLKPTQQLALTHEKRTILDLTKDVQLDVNHHRNQQFKDHVNTCGRHVVYRAMFPHMNNDEFFEKIMNRPIRDHFVSNGDVLVSLITGFLINKPGDVLR